MDIKYSGQKYFKKVAVSGAINEEFVNRANLRTRHISKT